MANELDELMDKDPLEMTSDDLAAIVAYHRRQRLRVTSGEKPADDAKPKVDLKMLGLIPQGAPIKRRV